MSHLSFYQSWIKRAIDLFCSLALLIILSPLFLMMSLLILITMGRPILFKQERPGFRGKPFMLLKFRTMGFQKEASGELSSDMVRMTPLGKYLRRLSLDEMPQLINIVLGQMSFIGPRPLLMEYLSLYSHEQSKRHDVVPGITGWAQVHGRNTISWQERFSLDIWYVGNASFMLDMKILCMTVLKVLRRDGINASDADTMKKFTGNP